MSMEFVAKDPLVNNGAPKTTVELLHTPGPWRIGTINYADVYGPDGEVIAMLPKGFPTTEPNAALIASAPDLLAALMKIAAWDDSGANSVLANRGSYAGFDEPGAVKIAREALAAVLR